MEPTKTYAFTDSEVAQILYCMESMAVDYQDSTPDFRDLESALKAIQTPFNS